MAGRITDEKTLGPPLIWRQQCSYSLSCSHRRQDGKRFCKLHGCAVTDCNKTRFGKQIFCSKHTCFVCGDKGLFAGLATNEPPRNTCVQHPLCHGLACLKLAENGQSFCKDHQQSSNAGLASSGQECNEIESQQRCLGLTKKGKPYKGNPFGNSMCCYDHKDVSAQGPNANESINLESSSTAEDKVVALENIYQEVSSEVWTIKAKLANSQLIKKEITRLEASEDCLSHETMAKQEKKLEELKIETEKIEQELNKALATARLIASLKQDPQLLTTIEEEELKCRLQQTEKVLNSIQGDTQNSINEYLLVQEEARKELECVICLKVPKAGEHIFSCNDHHLLCCKCNVKSITSCPVCRHVFGTSSPKRNRLAEKMIQKLSIIC